MCVSTSFPELHMHAGNAKCWNRFVFCRKIVSGNNLSGSNEESDMSAESIYLKNPSTL